MHSGPLDVGAMLSILVSFAFLAGLGILVVASLKNKSGGGLE